MTPEEPIKRRKVAVDVVANRAERKLMLPFRKRIGTLQTRMAFNAARAISSKSDRATIDAEYAAILAEITATLEAVNAAVAGRGLGPADDCRNALLMLLKRFP